MKTYLSNRVIQKAIRAMIRAYGAQVTYDTIINGEYRALSGTLPNRALRNFNVITTSHQYI